MKNHLRIIIYLLLSIVMVKCTGSVSKKAELQMDPVKKGVCIIFFKLDDFAKIYIDDILIYDTSESHGMVPKSDILVDLNPFLTKDTFEVKIELYNAKCEDCKLNRWSFIYELYQDNESLAFFLEDSNDLNDTVGLKVTQTYSVTIR